MKIWSCSTVFRTDNNTNAAYSIWFLKDQVTMKTEVTLMADEKFRFAIINCILTYFNSHCELE